MGSGPNVDLSSRTVVVRGLLAVAALVVLYTFLYNVGMSALEGRPQSLLLSLQVVVETLLTSGFGGDSPWQSVEMNVLVSLVDLTGSLVGLLALAAFVHWLVGLKPEAT